MIEEYYSHRSDSSCLLLLLYSIFSIFLTTIPLDTTLLNYDARIAGLSFLGQTLKWHRLDDGVMGGQSETTHTSSDGTGLHFTGQINTQGGGFCSIRTTIDQGLSSDTTAIKVSYLGDGKTYKVMFSDGKKSEFGPSRRNPSWQTDLPTKKGVEDTAIIRLDTLTPSLQGGPVATDMKLQATEVKEMGFMLSLKLSDGESNPVDTFGTGIFPFSLRILSIEPVCSDEK